MIGETKDRSAAHTHDEMAMAMLEKRLLLAVVDYQDSWLEATRHLDVDFLGASESAKGNRDGSTSGPRPRLGLTCVRFVPGCPRGIWGRVFKGVL